MKSMNEWIWWMKWKQGLRPWQSLKSLKFSLQWSMAMIYQGLWQLPWLIECSSRHHSSWGHSACVYMQTAQPQLSNLSKPNLSKSILSISSMLISYNLLRSLYHGVVRFTRESLPQRTLGEPPCDNMWQFLSPVNSTKLTGIQWRRWRRWGSVKYCRQSHFVVSHDFVVSHQFVNSWHVVNHYFVVSHHDDSCSQSSYECQFMTALNICGWWVL